MTEADHLFAGALLLLCVLLAFGKAPDQADSAQRWAFYRQAWIAGIGISAAALLLWYAAERPLRSFGLGSWTGDRPAVATGAAVLWVAALVLIVVKVSGGAGRERLGAIYDKYRAIMPTTPNELAGSWGAAVGAGISEEIAFRGFLLWYVASFADPLIALVVTSLLFGIAHGYQRGFGMIAATGAGLLLGAIYLGSGSLLLVIWMHATYNVASFSVGKIVLSPDREQPSLGSVSAS